MPNYDDLPRTRGADYMPACADKPSHVRRLNFGRSILGLNATDAPCCSRNGGLVLDRNVAGIPSTDRADFVRKWLETHEENSHRSSDDDESCISPVLGSSFADQTDRSPVLGNCKKRTRGKASLNGTVKEMIGSKSVLVTDAVLEQEDSTHFSISSCMSKRNERSVEENNSRKRKMSNTDCSRGPSFEGASPILARNTRLYNWSRKVSKQSKENLCDTPSTSVSRGISFVKASQMFAGDSCSYKKRRRIVCRDLRWKDGETSWNGTENGFVEADMNLGIVDSTKVTSPLKKINKLEFEKELCTLKHSFEGCSFTAKSKSNFTGSLDDFKENPNIEVDDATEYSNDDKDFTIVNSESDASLSKMIENVDSQDALLETKNLKYQEYSAFMAGCSSAVQSSCFSKNSEETFYALAEQAQCSFPSKTLQEKISQVSSKTTPTENKDSQTDIFIAETSLSRTNSDPAMYVNILDSVKKKKKPKKGSLVERMQTVVNRELSFVRIWRHQMKQTDISETTTVPVTVLVQKCTSRFGKQFIEGIILEDPSNQVYNTIMEESGQSVCQPQPNKLCQENITLMTIPDVIGKIELKSECIVQIYPPWEVVDKKKLILNVTYINILPNKEMRSIQLRETLSKDKKQVVVQEFSCPCIEANKVIPSCRGKADGKPNVMEMIFKF